MTVESTGTAVREVVLARVFDAPRERVFAAWTDPQRMARWWGPHEFTNPVCELDARPGGAILIHMRGPDGTVYPMTGVFQEIVPPERLVYTFEFEGMPGHILLETLTFEEQDGKTKLTDHALFDSVEDRDGMLNLGMEAGAAESLDLLEELLAQR